VSLHLLHVVTPPRIGASVDLTPRLITRRLELREWRDEDLNDATALFMDTDVNRYLDPVADRADCWRKVIALQTGHWALRRCGWWVVQRRTDGCFLGFCGLWNPEDWPGTELAWALNRSAWGQGYATEAARAALTWGWDTLPISEVLGFIVPGNHRPVLAAERLGFRRRGTTTIHDRVVDVYYLRRPSS
jgi:RimJ/RimL family protein N-acetyltransferase